ncbi:MAG: YjfB family protein [Chloroflexi bacterium]|nr:YjfB family protein [Chloroflexota bacterium]
MTIDPSSTVDAFSRLRDTSGEVALKVAVSVTKQVMDSAEQMTLDLLESLEPHLGQNLDVRA